MNNFLSPKKKYENNYSIIPNIFDLQFKGKNKRNSIFTNELFQSKKSNRSNRSKNNNEENSVKLSCAYKNINLMLSNCLESIRAEEKENETIKKPLFKDIKLNLLKKRKDGDIDNGNVNKSFSLSNSNILLTTEENFLNNLNNEKKNISKINNKKFEKSISVKSSNLNSKLSSLLSKNNNISLFSPKRTITKNKKNIVINHKKIENKYDLNNEKILSKLEKKNYSSTKIQKVKKKNEKEYNNIFLSSNIMSNYDISSKSIKKIYKKSKNSLNSYKNNKYNKSKTFVISINDDEPKNKANSLNETKLSKKFFKYLSLQNLSKNSQINEDNIKSFYNSKISQKNNRINKRPSTIIVTSKTFQNILNQSNQKNSFKNNKFRNTENEHLKILTLKEIGKNLKKSIIEYNLEKIKKELYDFENNEFSEMLNNLPEKPDDNKDNINSKISLNKTNNNQNITIDNEDEYLNNNMTKRINKKVNKFQYKYRKLFISKKVYDSLDDDENGDEENINTFYLSPNSFKLFIIDLFVLITSFIDLFYLPFFLAYYTHLCRIPFLSIKSILFYLTDLIYIIDLFSGFFRAYYDFEEFLIRDNLEICINYLTGWFFIDLIQAIPFYTIINLNEKKCDENKIFNNNLNYSGISTFHYSFLIIKILKVIKVFNNNRALNKMTHFLNNNDFFYNWRGFFSTLLISLSSLHLFSCLFIFLGKNVYSGWIVQCNLQSTNYYHIFIAALYYLMTTLTTVGYGDILVSSTYERFYQIIILIVGTCAYSWILTFISNYIKKQNERYIDFENKVNILGEIKINYPNLNNDLYERIIRYLNYNKSEYKYNIENILDSLPSSLQNNLIVEIYKPLIKNFHFFKSFENSDFFVKIVTSLKPILSMKDDILVQEGDIIEDIIFIKRGILTLEILIDLDSPKESAEDHLNMIEIGSLNILSQQQTKKGERVISINTNSNFNYSKINSKYLTKTEKKIKNKKAMKIIDLRKNEHFGDVLMILNERSPLTVKVKSKKAELFFLQKTDATEISNQYPNIWKRIVNKSLYNMKQIKKIIKKKILFFCDLNDVYINQELKKRYLEENEINNSNNNILIGKKISNKSKKNKKNNISPKKQIETIIYEEDEKNFDSMCNSYIFNNHNCKGKKHYSSNLLASNQNKNTTFKSNEKYDFSNISLKPQKDSIKEKISNYNIKYENNNNLTDEFSINKNNDNNKDDKNNSICNLNNMISIIDKKMKASKGQINNFNINIFTPKTVQIPINQISNQTSLSESEIQKKIITNNEDDKNIRKINEEIYYNEEFKLNILNHHISMNNFDNNIDMIYPKFTILERKDKNMNKKYNDNFINIQKLLDNNKNVKKEAISIENKNMINKNYQNNNNNKFLYLDNSQIISFTIYSIYDNINKLTNYKFQNDNLLQEKTKNFLINNCFSKQKSLDYSLDLKKRKKGLINSPISKNNFIHSHNENNENNSTVYNERLEEDILTNKNKNIKKIRFCSNENGKRFLQ